MAPEILQPTNQPQNDKTITHRARTNNKLNDDNQSQITHNHANGKNSHQAFKPQIRWPDFIVQLSLHVGFLYGLYYLITLKAKFYTYIWFLFLIYMTGLGITAGAHRLWSHRSYKAKLPLRVILLILFTMAGQRDAYTWAHDHRIHHKFSETNSDPHNAKRGFFFAHVGWLFLTPHPDVVEKRKSIDMRDLQADELLMWQKKYYVPLFALLVILIPTVVPYYFWNESLWISFWTVFVCRFVTVLNIAFAVNSVAHMFGDRPYDKNIMPVESLPVAIAAMGEGWHNYHHVFPYDYKTGEFGYKFNITTAHIDFFSKIGWAYDLKSASSEMIARKALKSGDGSYFLSHEQAHNTALWGYGDKDIETEDAKDLENSKILNKI